ncbi:MAG: hypothetical protein ACO3MG_10755 [Saprospiraceae bacterium]|jgi:hypothetical protein
MKYLKILGLFAVAAIMSSYDCGCSIDDGNGGNYTFYYNCNGMGDAVVEHYEDSYAPYPSSTHITTSQDAMQYC